ncbi:MAG: STT3 domain-containing protein [Candidatus Woesearchaeota archaeon]
MSKNKHKSIEESRTQETSDTIIDFSKIKSKAKKIKNAYSWSRNNIFTPVVNVWLLIIILIIVSVFVRMGPATLPITDQWAESTVISNMQNNIAYQVRLQRPDLPEASIQKIVQDEFNSVYNANKAQVDAQITTLSTQFKAELQNDQGQTHLLGIDEYVWYSYAKWYDRTGYYGTELVNGQPKFMLRYGRLGQATPFIVVSYPINLLHNLLSIFNKNQTVEHTAFYISIILMSLVCIPAFFLGRKMFGNIGGFFAAMTIVVSATIVGRTLIGAPESDGYTILFPLLITWLFFEALTSKKLWTTITFAALTGLSTALFFFFWGGWWFTFLLLIGMSAIYIVYVTVLRKTKHTKIFDKHLLMSFLIPVILVFATILFTALIALSINSNVGYAVKAVITAPIQPFDFITGFKSAAMGNVIGEDYALWPNVLRTVAELNPSTISDVIRGPGSMALGKVLIPFFYLGILGMILLFFRYKENNMYPFYGAFLLIWLMSTVYAGTTGVRFIVFVGIATAFGIGSLVSYLTGPGLNSIAKKMDDNKKTILKWTFVLILFFLLLWIPIKTAKAIGDQATPIFDDAWYESMDAISASSPGKAIITSWWDYGHFFQAFSEKTVTFDGGDQGKRIYWVGRTLITSEEDEAIDILKMMNCGEEEGYNLLELYTKDRMHATILSNKIMRQTKQEAVTTLTTAGLTSTQIDDVLKLTHCSDLYDMYFVTSEDMVGKATVWGHFGSWDFEKAYFFYHLKNLPLPEAIENAKHDLGYDTNKTRSMYNEAKKITDENLAASWISIYPGYVTQRPVSCQKDLLKNVVVCNYNILLNQQPGVDVIMTKGIINLNNISNSTFILQAVDKTSGAIIQQNLLIPAGIVYDNNGTLERITPENSNLGYDVSIYQNGDNYYSLISNEALSRSLFTKLFFMEGQYTTHFEKISDLTSFRGERIIVWKVNP